MRRFNKTSTELATESANTEPANESDVDLRYPPGNDQDVGDAEEARRAEFRPRDGSYRTEFHAGASRLLFQGPEAAKTRLRVGYRYLRLRAGSCRRDSQIG